MSALTLHRIDAGRNMRRFYGLDRQPDLFGGEQLIKSWGRIGTHGQQKAEHYETEALAQRALEKQAERKRRRGYR